MTKSQNDGCSRNGASAIGILNLLLTGSCINGFGFGDPANCESVLDEGATNCTDLSVPCPVVTAWLDLHFKWSWGVYYQENNVTK